MVGNASVMSQELEDIVRLDKKEINRSRHKHERRLYRLCVVINIIIILVVLGAFANFIFTTTDGITAQAESELKNNPNANMNFVMQEKAATVKETAQDDPGVQLFAFVMFSVIATIFSFYFFFAKTRAYSVRVSENNFPEIYYKSLEFSKKLGLKRIPLVYIRQESGVLNAFAAAIVGKRYIQINAEIVDVAYLEHKDFSTVFFVMGHEMGHIYCKHPTPSYTLKILFARMVPIIGPALSRAQEYSADRISQLLNGRDCVQEIMLLLAGRHLYKYVDTNAYLADTKNENDFFLWLVNLQASHPIAPKRIAAIADPERKSGKLL